MIGFAKNGQHLRLAPGTRIPFEWHNPLFANQVIPGLVTYDFSVPQEGNKALLGYPELTANTADFSTAMEGWTLFLEHLPFRTQGRLQLREGGTDTSYNLRFVADSRKVQDDIAGKRLSDLTWPEESITMADYEAYPDNFHYAFYPVRNPSAIDLEALPTYCGYVNYFRSGVFRTSSMGFSEDYFLSPYPRLTWVLHQILEANLGYVITGDWITGSVATSTTLYHNYLSPAADSIYVPWEFAMPDMTVGEFLLAVQNRFNVAFLFHPTRKEVALTARKEVMADTSYRNMKAKIGRRLDWATPSRAGATLLMTADDTDAQGKDRGKYWLSSQSGNGKLTITTQSASPYTDFEEDSLLVGRYWTIPVVDQRGIMTDFTQDESGQRLTTAQFLTFYGMQEDQSHNLYPQAGYLPMDSFSDVIPGFMPLRWVDDVLSIPALADEYSTWLDFLNTGRTEEFEASLTISDLCTISYTQKWRFNEQLWMWKKIAFTGNLEDGLDDVKVELMQTRNYS